MLNQIILRERLVRDSHNFFFSMSDFQVLHDYFYCSRYITAHVLAKYGLDASMYSDSIGSDSITKLKKRVRQLLTNEEFHPPENGDELRRMLGSKFHWVKSSLDDLP